MLNISDNSINDWIEFKNSKSYQLLRKSSFSKNALRTIIGVLVFVFISLFLPWTQNIMSKGYVTTRSPQQRPQSIQSVLPGRIENWYVQEGDFVAKGDTIAHITEVKSEYFDPNILERTEEQIDAKAQSIVAYQQKVAALEDQYKALQNMLKLKHQQTENKIIQAYNKIKIDSNDLFALEQNIEITRNQVERAKELYGKGLKSLTDLQQKEYKLQSEIAKVSAQENKLINQKNELSNLQIELSVIESEYADKLSKSLSEKQTALSNMLESVAQKAKLESLLSSYTERQKLHYITAPQSGYVTKSVKKGIGETLKEGAVIVTIMPSNYELALEIYVEPQDIPLLSTGTIVNIRFDGWPAIVIRGWPEASTGIFKGKVVAIDRYISDNGKYRIMISQLADKKVWPEKLSIGTGAHAYILLNKVPLWYEVWRKLNGFPADYYQESDSEKTDIKRKAPLKSVK